MVLEFIIKDLHKNCFQEYGQFVFNNFSTRNEIYVFVTVNFLDKSKPLNTYIILFLRMLTDHIIYNTKHLKVVTVSVFSIDFPCK